MSNTDAKGGMNQESVLRFERRIDATELRQYLRIPFEVEPDVDELTIAYAYQRHQLSDVGDGRTVRTEINIVDLALENPRNEMVGASGSGRQQVTIRENCATPGYLPARLEPGRWFLVLGAYVIAPDGCPVEITITQHKKGRVLLRGDCHLHTVHSDGWYTVDEVMARARQDRLDYLFFTDHNSMTSNEELRSGADLTVLPGVEITYYDGHYNLYGLKRPVRTYTANSREEVLRIMREGRSNGALCSLNHPMCENYGWKFGFDSDVPADLIEIWNGPFTERNMRAVYLWQQHLAAGRRWPAIGGSDCHHDELFRLFAAPTTFFLSRSRGGSDILEAMRAGHAFVGMDSQAPTIDMAVGQALMGDSIASTAGNPLRLTVERLGEADEIRLIDQTGVIYSEKPGASYRLEREIPLGDSSFARVEIWRQLPAIGTTLASISNPIYLDGR